MLVLRAVRRMLLAAPVCFATLALASPHLGVTPGQVNVHAVSGQQVLATLSLRNTGDSTLDVALSVRPHLPAPGPALRAGLGASTLRAGDGSPLDQRLEPALPSARPWREATGPFAPTQLALPAAPAAPGAFRVLVLASGADLSEILPLLQAMPELGGVDVWDVRLSTPDLAALQPYAAVVTMFDFPALNAMALGDALADYVDQGGGVVLTIPSFVSGWEIQGRFLTGGYMPFNLGTGPIGGASLGAFDAGHPIMAGVHALQGTALAVTTPAPGATLVASWDIGQPLVAVKGHVAGINLFVAYPGYWTGDAPRLIANALIWSAGGPSWLTLSPDQASLAPGEERLVTLTFDATGLDEGPYDADVVLSTNDPSNAHVRVPAHLDVTGIPAIGLGGGEQTMESSADYFGSGARTSHRFELPVLPDSVRVELVADGDYGDPGEVAAISIEGNVLGSAGATGFDCTAARGTFPLVGAALAAVKADGVAEGMVQNSSIVDAICAVNRHTVRLRFDRPVDRVECDTLFVGRVRELELAIRNTGSALLHVASIASSNPVFSVDRDTLTLRPRAEALVHVRFAPLGTGEVNGTLSVSSDDPATPLASIAVHGVGVLPPDIDVSPLAVSAGLFTGGSARRSVTVRNLGGTSLRLRLQARSFPLVPSPLGGAAPVSLPATGDASLRAGTPEPPGGEAGASDSPPPPRSNEPRPASVSAVPTQLASGASVLLVLDTAPWGGLADQTVLGSLGVTYDLVGSAQLAALDLGAYRLVIVGADQPTSTYVTLRQQAARLEDFVRRGGTLEVHAAGWGYAGGDASQLVLPGGMRVFQHYAGLNQVLLPAHPLVAGVPSPFTGTSASHASFTGVPPGASVVATDDVGNPNLVTYPVELGLVIASGQTLEYGYAVNEAAGQILRNMIPFALASAPNWLSVSPAEAVVPAGGSLDVTLTLDATGLGGGDREGHLLLSSNDPDESEVTVAASLHVTGAPDLRAIGREHVFESRAAYGSSGASTTHRLEIAPVPTGEVTFQLEAIGDYGDFGETATLEIENRTFGTVGETRADCISARGDFPRSAPDAAPIVADGVVDAIVRNSAAVDAFCQQNEHVVRVRYRESGDLVAFRDTYAGTCDSSSLTIRNAGTEPLVVSGMTLDHAGFSVSPTSFTLAPGEGQDLQLLFCPGTPTEFAATMTIASNDPDAAVTTVHLAGRGVVPPDLAISPASVHADVFTNDEATRALEIQNRGGTPLTYRIHQRAAPVVALRAAMDASPPAAGPVHALERDPVTSIAAPGAIEGTPAGRSDQPRLDALRATLAPRLASGDVLLVEDVLPWGSDADQALWHQVGVTVDRIPAASFAALDLDRYSTIVVASDQPTSFYTTLSLQQTRLETWVSNGGLLQAQVAGWGSYGGDASQLLLPGGARPQLRINDVNQVVRPGHPIVAGISPTFTGTAASHGYLTGLPADAEVLTRDPQGGATLAVYGVGAGTVVAGVQPYEWGVLYGQATGQILRNMIAFARASAGPRWLRVDPVAGSVPPGASATITLRFASDGLPAGDYARELEIQSNDPDLASLAVPVTMRISDAPHLVVSGRAVVLDSDQDFNTPLAVTRHHFHVGAVSISELKIELDVDGDFGDPGDYAMLTVDGISLAQVGATGAGCTPAHVEVSLTGDALATVLADGVVEAVVQNSPSVGAFCARNHHHVRLSFREPAEPVAFGDRFLGTCATRELSLINAGTAPLTLSGFEMSRPEFTFTAVATTLPPGGEAPATLAFCPQAAGTFDGTWTIVSDDPRGARRDVALHGAGLVPPEIAAAPSPLVEDLFPGERSVRTLRVWNRGGSDLKASLRLTLGVTLPQDAAVAGRLGGETPAQWAALQRLTARYGDASLTGAGGAPPATAKAAAAPRALSPSSLTTIFSDDMESGFGAWRHYPTAGGTDAWARTQFRASGGSWSWTVSQHSVEGADALQSPDLDLTAFHHVQLTFRHFYRFDDCSDPSFEPDGGIVEAQAAGDSAWVQLTPVGGYPYLLDDYCGNPLALRPAWAHDGDDHGAFLTATFDLSGYAGRVMRFRFHAGWDCGNCDNNEGWYIDDVAVTSDDVRWLALAPTAMTVGPDGHLDASLAFDSRPVTPGDWNAVVDVSSNDPATPLLSVPVTMHVANMAATLTLDHRTLEPDQGGPWLKATLTLPDTRVLEDVDPASVTLNGVPAERVQVAGDAGQRLGDGAGGSEGSNAGHPPKMMFRVDRAAVLATFSGVSPQALNLSGLFRDGERFLARDSVALRGDGAAQASALAQGRPDGGAATSRSGIAAAPLEPAFAMGPNPVRRGSALRVALTLPRSGWVEAAIYSPAGRLVRTLASGSWPAGQVALEWDGRDRGGHAVEPGVYLVRVLAPGLHATRRAVLLR